MSTLLVGCGYLGRRVGLRLWQAGERVFGTSRTASRAADLAPWGVEPLVADVLDASTLTDLPACDRVLFCVGYDRRSGASQRDVYVAGLKNLLGSLASVPGCLVYTSSTSVYGQSAGEWVDEGSSTVPTSPAGRVLLEAEELLTEWGARHGVSVAVVRYSGLYGPGRVIRRAALEQGEPIPADPEGYLNLIHIDDAAAAAAAALGQRASGVFVASDDRPVRRREFYETAARLLNAPPPRFQVSTGAEPNRRVRNERLKGVLGVRLAFPDISVGLPDAVGRGDRPPLPAGQSDGAGSM